MPLPAVPPPGIYCPAITFFNPSTDTLDLESQTAYYKYLSGSGLTGLVILGTNAEAFLLTASERATLIKTARDAVGPEYPIIAGCGAHSTAQVLEHLHDAAAAGANYALVLPPAYFGKATTPSVIKTFFNTIAVKSPIPIVIYNFPGVCNGVDLDSEIIGSLAAAHPGKIVGVKLTCASVGKITRLSAQFPPEKNEFAIFGGQSDFLLGGLASGSAGCIAAFANVFPKTICKIYNLYREGKGKEALELHRKAALAESPCKAGISSTKYAAAIYSVTAAGIEEEKAIEICRPRAPYEECSAAVKDNVRKVMAEVAEIERGL